MKELNDDQKTFLKEAVNTAVSGLKEKNDELLGKLKKTTKQLNGFEGVDVVQLAKDSKALKKLQQEKDKKDNNYKKLYDQQSEQHTTETAKLTKERDKAKTKVEVLKKTTSLQKALIMNHVDPVMMEAAESMLLPSVSLTDEGKAKVGDKTIADHIKEWAVTDVGKRFVSDGNSGGGSGGDGGSKGNSDAKYFDKKSEHYNITKQAQINKTNPALYAKLVKPLKKK